MSSEIVSLVLYVTGDGARAKKAIANLKTLGEEVLPGRCDFSVVDVLESPAEAESHRILATPTLVKLAPGSVRRVIGDLSDTVSVLAALGIESD